MTPQLKALAKKMAENKFPDDKAFKVRRAYLAGFEARDGMDSELLQMFKDALRFIPPSEFRTECKEFITKIESK